MEDSWYEKGLEKINNLYTQRLIQLSQMVEDKKLSETNARIIFQELRADHNKRVGIWRLFKP